MSLPSEETITHKVSLTVTITAFRRTLEMISPTQFLPRVNSKLSIEKKQNLFST